MNIKNPFLACGYFWPKYVCDREEESARIVQSLENEGDVALIAPRRYGKTGLIQHVFGMMPKDVVCVYLDIYATNNLADFSKELATAAVSDAVTDIVDMRRQEYHDLYRMQNDSSRRLLKAQSAEGPVDEPMSGAFVARNGLRATSSVSAALAELEGRDLIYRTPDGYVVYDRFFNVWLKGIP